MDKHFRACAVCTSTCFKEHGADSAPHYTRPPCFLLTSLEIPSNWTPIPKEFVDAHGETLRGTARILGPNGKEWSVEIGGPAKFLGFKGGWKNFVASSSVKRGDQMLFSLVSNRCFAVHVFNKLGVEVVPSPPVDTKYIANGKRKRQEIKAEIKAEPESGDESDHSSDDSDMSEYDAAKSDAEPLSESDTEPKVEDEEILSKPRKRVKNKFTRSTPKELTPKRSLTHKKKVKANTTKCGMYIEPGSCTTTYESRRREVTQAELDRTMQKARAHKAEFPSIPVLMMPSHVYRGFWLTIPGRFSKEFLPQEKTEVTLVDKDKYEWTATWISNNKHTGLSGGWAAFSKDHCLEEGDVCVFEVTKSAPDCTILVHIFRVVKVDLEPGTRGEWEKTYNIVHGALMHQPKKSRSRSSTVKKSRKRTVTKSPSSTVKQLSRKKAAPSLEESDTEGSDVEKSDAEEDDDGEDEDDNDVPLTKLYKEMDNSNVTSEEVDVKPKIISMGPIPKITKVKQEPGMSTVKVKQEPGVMPTVKVKQEPGVSVIHSRDVKPTLEELKASLSQASCTTSVKPEPVIDTEPLKNNNQVGRRTWHPVVRMINKRQSPKSPGQHEFLVNLGPRVICTSASGGASEDGNGNWWVPRSQFSSDLASCYID